MNPPVETSTSWSCAISMISRSARSGISVNEPPANFSASTCSPIVSSTSVEVARPHHRVVGPADLGDAARARLGRTLVGAQEREGQLARWGQRLGVISVSFCRRFSPVRIARSAGSGSVLGRRTASARRARRCRCKGRRRRSRPRDRRCATGRRRGPSARGHRWSGRHGLPSIAVMALRAGASARRPAGRRGVAASAICVRSRDPTWAAASRSNFAATASQPIGRVWKPW